MQLSDFMNEYLLQFIWQNSLYNAGALRSQLGEAITVINPGRRNVDAGPDFLEARIKIGDTLWIGNVELHVRSSDWQKHGHDADPAYSNIILHVVYIHDKEVGINQSVIALKPHIHPEVINRYISLMTLTDSIPCAAQLHSVPDILWTAWLDTMVAERWEQRLQEWQQFWRSAANDWRCLLYYRLAANFGFHVNRDAFLELALSLPLNVLVKHKNNLNQIEALLFGQAGLLPDTITDEYTAGLEKEYHFLRRKYQLIPIPAHRWKFMRLRPPNFPTIRIAQFAALIHHSLELFAKMMEVKAAAELLPLLDVSASKYWNTHYRFGEQAKDEAERHLGKDAAINIMINTVAPMQYLYAKLEGKTKLLDNSLSLLQSLKSENNNIIRMWQGYGIKAKDAAMSQALLQLYNAYCVPKRCLDCAIGNRIMKRSV
jgi:hypothetical protein